MDQVSAPLISGDKKKENRIWILVLVGLIVVAALIAIVIAIVKLNTRRPVSIQEKNDVVSEIQKHILPLSEEDTISYLDEKISEYSGSDLSYDIRNIKINALRNMGKLNEAVEVISDEEISKLSYEYKLLFCRSLMDVYSTTGDDAKVNYYLNEFRTAYEKLYGDEGNIYNSDEEEVDE